MISPNFPLKFKILKTCRTFLDAKTLVNMWMSRTLVTYRLFPPFPADSFWVSSSAGSEPNGAVKVVLFLLLDVWTSDRVRWATSSLLVHSRSGLVSDSTRVSFYTSTRRAGERRCHGDPFNHASPQNTLFPGRNPRGLAGPPPPIEVVFSGFLLCHDLQIQTNRSGTLTGPSVHL